MDKRLISRVILLPDGSAHIATEDKHTISCTVKHLSLLLSDPIRFLIDWIGAEDIIETTTITNPGRDKYSLEYIPGLSILKVYSDAEIVCIFPKLFKYLFQSYQKDSIEQLNLKEIANDMEISDEKHYLMKFFFNFTSYLHKPESISHRLGISLASQTDIMMETFNTAFNSNVSKEEVFSPSEPALDKKGLFTSVDENDGYIKKSEWCKLKNIPTGTVDNWLHNNKIRGAKKINDKWYIHKDSPIPQDLRETKNNPNLKRPRLKDPAAYRRKNPTPEDVKNYVIANDIVSEKVAPYVYSIAEAEFYRNNNYREIEYNGTRFLVIDVNPNYCYAKEGKSNLERMLSGDPPYDSKNEGYVFGLHHIGQNDDSPIAIISSAIHKGKSSIFHDSGVKAISNQDNSINRTNFELLKESFWIYFGRKYSVTGSYYDIEYLNHKTPPKSNPKTKKR